MKNCVGMLLAGGEGKRLGKLTDDLAKPAVHFGGKYRIIDFPLSNCTNSNIRTVGIMTQYAPLKLNEHIGNGSAWGLSDQNSGTAVLSPYIAQGGGDWYSGTADAIYQNIHFIDRTDPEYVLVISGDHIYQMDYSKMLAQHIEKESHATISVMPVPWEEAPRFGILNTNDDMSIYEFDEKPAEPKSNLASMGIYIFSWRELRQYLVDDAANPESTHDFGNDIIPAMLADDLKLCAYQFEGYWKDVGTIQSYWEANMDMLDDHLQDMLNNSKWRIYTNESNTPPQYIGPDAKLVHSLISAGCIISGTVDHSILSENVEVGRNSRVCQSILHPNVTIGQDVVLHRVIVMEDVHIPAGTVLEVQDDEEPIVLNKEAAAALHA